MDQAVVRLFCGVREWYCHREGRCPGQSATYRARTSGENVGQVAGRPHEWSKDSRYLQQGNHPRLTIGFIFWNI